MVDADLPEFTRLLDSLCALLTRGTYVPNDTSTMIFFRALKPFSLAAVRAGFTEHASRSPFSPTPADILGLLRENDGRPGPEEAWTIALTARNEDDTVVWTTEIAEAWDAARTVMRLGDEVGARMAFKEAYTARLALARRKLEPARWVVCEGHDAKRRIDAVRAAVDKGLKVERAAELLALPLPRAEPERMLRGPEAVPMPDSIRERLNRLREPKPYAPGPDVLGRRRTEQLRREQLERVREYAAKAGIDVEEPPCPPRGTSPEAEAANQRPHLNDVALFASATKPSFE